MKGLPLDRLLTELVGRRALDSEPWGALDADAWLAIDRLAGDHRCRPALHRLRADEALVPRDIRTGWSDSFRAATLVALGQRAELVRVTRELAAHGIAMAALKGAWLAWDCYPEPGMRPMRDLDILVDPDDAPRVRDLLLARGYSQPEDTALPLEDWLARFKHLPALVSPEGIVIEVHTRLWDDDGRMPPHPPGLLDRRVESEAVPGLFMLSPADSVMHLAVHAAFHRLDGGPLMLLDFAMLADRAGMLDLTALWDRAEREGWLRHAALCIHAADRWTAPGTAAALSCPVDVPDTLLMAIPSLLAKPLDARESDIASAKIGRADIGLGEKLRRIAVRRERYEHLRDYIAWVGAQARGAMRSRSSQDDRARLAAIAQLDDWLKN